MRDRRRNVARDGQFDGARVTLDFSVEQRDVGLLDEAVAKILDELAMRGVRARDHDHTGGFLVEAMDDPRTQRAADGGESRDSAEAVQKRGHHGAAGDARARMDDHAGGLVDDGDVFVLVENIERNGFGFDAGRQLIGDLDGHDFVRLDAMRGLARDAVNLHAAFVHERLNARTAQRRELRDEKEVESLAGVFGSDDEFHVCGGFYATSGPLRRGRWWRAESERRLHGRGATGKRR